jgi:hypothetical protein
MTDRCLRTGLRLTRLALAAGFVAAIALLLQMRSDNHDARAFHHVAEISEVMSGFDGDADVQFVEVTLLSIYQNEVANTRLTAFNPDGTLAGVLLDPLGSDIGLFDTKILMGTSAFEAAAGVSADFVFSPGILPAAGMVCWGAPGESAPAPGSWSASDPDNYVDCVSYGGASFTGTNPMSPNPSPFGAGDDIKSLTRNTGSSGKLTNPWRNSDDDLDFKLAAASPTNSNGEAGKLNVAGTPAPTPTPGAVGGVALDTDLRSLPLDAREPSGSREWPLAAAAALVAFFSLAGLAYAWRRARQ